MIANLYECKSIDFEAKSLKSFGVLPDGDEPVAKKHQCGKRPP
jgi:hypothetical protein